MKYYYVSIGMNCVSRKSFDYFYNSEQPYLPFDWCLTGNLKDCARAINNNFKNYLEVVSVKKSDNNLDLEKIKILVRDESRNKLQRQQNKNSYKQNVYQSHKYYPSIIEYHYDFNESDDKEKNLRRIERLEYLIKNKKPILFVRIIIYPIVKEYYFFNLTYIEGLKNCYEFLETLNSIENIKVLFIHYFYNPNIKKDIINNTFTYYLDSYEIISNHLPTHYSDKFILNKFFKPILQKYNFEI